MKLRGEIDKEVTDQVYPRGAMSKIQDRYASAVHSHDLKSRAETTYSDTDVLGAAGLAAKRSPLAIALMRLFAGDDRDVFTVVRIMTDKVVGKTQGYMPRADAESMARAVLAWFRDGTCRACGGHGFQVIPQTRTLSDIECLACRGRGKIPFEREFSVVHRDLARWLLAEVEREQAIAGQEAMKKLAPRMDL